jgi:hypothetical protein
LRNCSHSGIDSLVLTRGSDLLSATVLPFHPAIPGPVSDGLVEEGIECRDIDIARNTIRFCPVTEVAHELGYVPNRQAQALKTKRTRTLTCVVPDVGIQMIADAAGYDVIVLNTDGSAERERRFLD